MLDAEELLCLMEATSAAVRTPNALKVVEALRASIPILGPTLRKP